MKMKFATLAAALLAIPAASVGVESLFSRAKRVATDQRASLDPELFEQIECLKYTWRGTIDDLAAENEAEIERIEMGKFENMERVEELYRQAVSESDREGAE